MFWEEGWAFCSAWKTASRTHSMTGSQQFTPLSFPHVGPEVQSWTYQQVKPAIFVHSQTAALRQNGVGKWSLPQHCASSVLSSHLSSRLPCKPTIVMPYHRTSVCTGVITKAVIFFKLRVCQLIQPEWALPAYSFLLLLQACTDHDGFTQEVDTRPGSSGNLFLRWGFCCLLCVLKAERSKHINCYKMNDICLTVQVQRDLYIHLFLFYFFFCYLLQHHISDTFVVRFYCLSFRNNSVT